MEGDAGASRLNPIDADDSLKPEDPPETETVAEEPSESGDGADQSETEDSSESDGGADQDAPAPRGPSRLSRGWLVGIAVLLVLCAGGIGAGGYLALRFHHDSQVIARTNAAALKAAIDCVSATQAPDTNAMLASEQKIIDCGTGAFRSQALVYTSQLVQAYQAANIHVEVSDVRGAVERNNPDGSVDVLVALRVKVANEQQQNETGYRLRVKMAMAEGQYRISKLDQVTK
ncbi:MAG: Mce protein [Mycobacterium sp.]|uniref:Mce protein n=1 Tax=Mycobacterium sp. TaxID=1785 RepID=UPI001EC6577B|nr:Mce protein [Mycobacterium sp.]MBV8786552.1 Mce protein [Mycobacterium sp.]